MDESGTRPISVLHFFSGSQSVGSRRQESWHPLPGMSSGGWVTRATHSRRTSDGSACPEHPRPSPDSLGDVAA
jgi:hypothetical protein